MSTRRRHLLCYDIRSPDRLRRVHRVAREWGHPLQYSIFVCDLTRSERINLTDALRAVVDDSADSITLFDLGAIDDRTRIEPVVVIGPEETSPEPGPTIV